ncbi:uncharacterized protein EI90DRAFT_3037621, partial [Cantharellus anzutake]|uniref:uncharacterized protein n=1 Tax=Cantharellus anzutake TaxID=1750568 RepID=UPI001907B4BB
MPNTISLRACNVPQAWKLLRGPIQDYFPTLHTIRRHSCNPPPFACYHLVRLYIIGARYVPVWRPTSPKPFQTPTTPFRLGDRLPRADFNGFAVEVLNAATRMIWAFTGSFPLSSSTSSTSESLRSSIMWVGLNEHRITASFVYYRNLEVSHRMLLGRFGARMRMKTPAASTRPPTYTS